LTLFLGLGLTRPQVSQADDIYTFVIKKQEVKDKYRWSLADWLDTRDRLRLQDLWLAIHSPSPYEYYIGGNYQINQNSPGGNFKGREAFAGAFATIFGLEGRYTSDSVSRWMGQFNFRIFGYHDQATNITLHLGFRNTNTGTFSYNNPYGGAGMTLYLARFFGVTGLYHHFFMSPPNSSNVIYSGDYLEGGAFLDFRFLRVYGSYFNDAETGLTTKGITLGSKLYF